MPPAVEAQSFNHWTSREVLASSLVSHFFLTQLFLGISVCLAAERKHICIYWCACVKSRTRRYVPHSFGNGNSFPSSCLEKFHGQGSLASYSPWGRRVKHDWVTEIPRTGIAVNRKGKKVLHFMELMFRKALFVEMNTSSAYMFTYHNTVSTCHVPDTHGWRYIRKQDR